MFAENSTGAVNESWQVINSTTTIDVRGDTMNVTMNHSDPAGTLSEITSETIDTSSGVTGIRSIHSYWRVDNINQSTFAEYQNNNTVSTFATQHLARDRQIGNFRSITNYTRVNVTPPSISGTCSNCNYRQAALNASGFPGDQHNETYNASGDWVDNGTYAAYIFEDAITDDQSATLTLNRSVSGQAGVPATLFVQYNFSQHDPGTWSQKFALVNVSVDANENTYARVNVTGTPVPELNDAPCPDAYDDFGDYCRTSSGLSDGSTQYTYLQFLEPTTIEVENTTIKHKIDASRFLSWEDRQDVEAWVNGTQANISWSDGSGGITVTITTNYSTSSLEDKLYETKIQYNDGASSSSGGGGGGGGSTSPDTEPRLTAPSMINVTVFGSFGKFDEIDITNNRDESYNITITPVRGDACPFITFGDVERATEIRYPIGAPGPFTQNGIPFHVRPLPKNISEASCFYEIRHESRLITGVTINLTHRPGFFNTIISLLNRILAFLGLT